LARPNTEPNTSISLELTLSLRVSLYELLLFYLSPKASVFKRLPS